MKFTYKYEDVPNLAKSVVDMANADIMLHHKHRASIDHGFIVSMFDAQYRVELELLKMKYPNQTVSWPENSDYPVIGCVVHNPEIKDMIEAKLEARLYIQEHVVGPRVL